MRKHVIPSIYEVNPDMHRLTKEEIYRLGPPDNFKSTPRQYIYNETSWVDGYYVLFQEVRGGEDWFYQDRISSQTVQRIICLDNYGAMNSVNEPFLESGDRSVSHNLSHAEEILSCVLLEQNEDTILKSKSIVTLLSRLFGPPLFDINQKLSMLPDADKTRMIFYGFNCFNRIYLIRFSIILSNGVERYRYIDICLPFNEPRSTINEKIIYDTLYTIDLGKGNREFLEELIKANKL